MFVGLRFIFLPIRGRVARTARTRTQYWLPRVRPAISYSLLVTVALPAMIKG